MRTLIQVLLTSSAELQGAQSPAPRGTFALGSRLTPWAPTPEIRLKPCFVSEPPDFFAVVRQGGAENRGLDAELNELMPCQ